MLHLLVESTPRQRSLPSPNYNSRIVSVGWIPQSLRRGTKGLCDRHATQLDHLWRESDRTQRSGTDHGTEPCSGQTATSFSVRKCLAMEPSLSPYPMLLSSQA